MQKNKDIRDVYTLEKTLGEGVFGVVRRAVKKSTGEPFAVKIISMESLSNEDQLTLQKEVKILTQIDHPNVVKLYEIYEDHPYFYMVLELMTGGELFERIVEKDHFSEKDAAIVLRQIIDALAYCHKMGIVHQNLQPENLLYSTIQPEALVKICNFGLARFVGSEEVMMTQYNNPCYMAPEIINGQGYTQAIDFWSVGIILYIMLCGFPPFYDEDNDKLFQMINTGSLDFPSPQWDQISNEAKDLIKGLLIIDPAKRLTAEEILKHPWLFNNTHKSIVYPYVKKKTIVHPRKFKIPNFLTMARGWAKMEQVKKY